MKRTRVVDDGIARRLEDGWDYRPDWRARLVKRMRAQHREFCDVIFSEKDPYVRQLFRLRAKGECAGEEAFRWAEKCHANRKSSIASGLIKAMTIARCPAEEIALRLHTSKFAVAVFQKLFFDIRRYQGNRAWLASVALAADSVDVTNPILAKERLLTAAAFRGGVQYIKMVMLGLHPASKDLADMQREIRELLLQKAHQFLLLGGSPSAADLERYLDFLRLPAATDDDKMSESRKCLAKLEELFHGKKTSVMDSPRLSDTAADAADLQQSFSNC